MRRLMVTALVILLCLATPVDAVEADRSADSSGITFTDSRPGSPGGPSARPPGPRSRAGAGDSRPWYRVKVVTYRDGQPCWIWTWSRSMFPGDAGNILLQPDWFQPCPGRTAGPADQTEALAAAAWSEVKDLPVPTVSPNPHFAITGKELFLTISGPDTYQATVDNPVGDDIVISATSYYVVDWDDPTWPQDTVTVSHGGPWPDGDLRHIYTHTAPAARIAVTQHWEADWSAGARSGTLDDLVTRAEPLAVPVRQVEAVRDR